MKPIELIILDTTIIANSTINTKNVVIWLIERTEERWAIILVLDNLSKSYSYNFVFKESEKGNTPKALTFPVKTSDSFFKVVFSSELTAGLNEPKNYRKSNQIWNGSIFFSSDFLLLQTYIYTTTTTINH